MDILKLLRERTNYRFVAVSAVTAIIGAGLLILVQIKHIWVGYEIWQGLVHEVGTLLVVSVALGALWELAGKRTFRDELLSVAKLSVEVQEAGLVGLTVSFEENIEWDKLFQNTYHLDVVFAYARSWRGTHETKIKRLAAKKGAQIRVFLPDVDDETVVNDLSRRFSLTEDEFKARVLEAEKFFHMVCNSAGKKGGTVEIWRCKVNFVFTAYRFDDRAILSLYSHLREKEPPPAFIIESNGRLYRWTETQIDGLANTSNQLAKRIVAPVSPPVPNRRP